MLLAIDLRNNAVVAGFRDEGLWLSVASLGIDRTADELSFFLEAAGSRAAASAGLGGRDLSVRSAWISSVVPGATPKVAEAVRVAFGVDPAIVGPGTKTGMKIRTENPSELGSDIVCAAVAAHAKAGRAVIVVDFGAALVLSAVNSSSELLGASIAPGLGTAVLSLRARAAQIPDVRLDAPRRAIGRNTPQSVQSGILLGYGGLVQRLVGLMREEMGEDAAVIGTGEEAGRAIMAGIGYGAFEPYLALDGMALLAERNAR